MARHELTKEQRQKGGRNAAAARKQNNLARQLGTYAPTDEQRKRYEGMSEEERNERLLFVLWAIADADTVPVRTRIAAIRNLLPYQMAKIAARELEGDGSDPININVQLVEANAARHGEIDPAEFSAPTPREEKLESKARRQRRPDGQQ